MLIRVLEIGRSSGKFCSPMGNPQVWMELDWFRDDGMPERDEATTRDDIIEFVKGKRYYNVDRPLLILSEAWAYPLNYKKP